MPPVLMKGRRVGSYVIEAILNRGAFAIAYKARDLSGKVVFLKQYKSPTVTTPWYRAYIQYQNELKKRVESTRMRDYSYRFLEFFECDIGIPCYFQAFEFADGGCSLDAMLSELSAKRRPDAWTQRVILAKVFAAGLAALHETKIVHCDLKPQNVQLFNAPHIEARYKLKIIDLDFAILSDVRPPWHGDPCCGFVGTPGYQSPEHLQGKVPVPASDVFTAGLILYELLAGDHPYQAESEEQYARLIRAHGAGRPGLLGTMPTPAHDEAVREILWRCLAPDAAQRPTIGEVHRTLTGLDRGGGRLFGRLVLAGPRGRMTTGVTMTLGRGCIAGLTTDSEYWASEQCQLVRTAEGWVVKPLAAANETLLNGRALRSEILLKAGDVIAVGRDAKRIAKALVTIESD